MKNSRAGGVRQASDFLIALRLTGAAKIDSVVNLTVRLPVVVIGGGLTAIDTETQSLAALKRLAQELGQQLVPIPQPR